MNKLFMIVGLSASGKSTYAKELAIKENAVIHASDELRKELFGDTNDNTQNDKLFQELHKRIKEDLKSGKNVVYDATNINYKRRMAFLQEIKNIPCEKITVVIATPYEDCLAQNKTRERQVPEHVITRMYKNFYIPQKYEGWDDIRIIWNTGGRIFCVHELFNGEDGLNYINQDNKHHTLTIGEHNLKCSSICESLKDDFELSMAALYHDIGKRFTKDFRNAKGEPTDEAHFYQHHLVSAYDAMFYLKDLSVEGLLYIIQLITWHMQPFNGISEKFIKMAGQEFYNDLMILHEADKMAK